MALVTVTRSEPIMVTWVGGTLLIKGATLNLACQVTAEQMDRMNRGHEGLGTATATIINWDDGVP